MHLIRVKTVLKTEGGLEERTFMVNSDTVEFIFKPPMQPTMIQASGTIITQQSLDELAAPNLVRMQTPEGVDALVNPNHIVFYTQIQLSLYMLMMRSSGKLVVKMTEA